MPVISSYFMPVNTRNHLHKQESAPSLAPAPVSVNFYRKKECINPFFSEESFLMDAQRPDEMESKTLEDFFYYFSLCFTV